MPAWDARSQACSQSGMMYAQVQTPGFSVRLEAQEQTFKYHTDMEQTVVLCNSNLEERDSIKNPDKNVDDGWPNETKDGDVIISTPTK